MAEMLKQQLGLLAFTVTIDTTQAPFGVLCLLKSSQAGKVAELQRWRCTAAELGLPVTLEETTTTGEGLQLKLPPYLIEGLAHSLQDAVAPGEVLWLHLQQPYGYLDLVPWEALLQPRLGIPILRLPEFLVDLPQTSTSTLNVVLCSSLPASKMAFAAVDHLYVMAKHLVQMESSKRVTVDVFTDLAIYAAVQSRIAADATLAGRVTVHDPQTAAAYAPSRGNVQIQNHLDRLENPWLLWMRAALTRRSIDVVHFLTHGYYFQEQGALAFAQSPVQNEDRLMARFVGVGELSTFLTQVGASTVAFSSPEENYSVLGLRRLANSVAQLRPGPVLYHDLAADPNCTVLDQAYTFLFGAHGNPPATPNLILYCHPARLAQPSASPRGMVEADQIPPEAAPGYVVGTPSLTSTGGLTRYSPTYQATNTGSGAIAQGPGATAAGERGVAIRGDVKNSPVVTGDGNTIQQARGRNVAQAAPGGSATVNDHSSRSIFNQSGQTVHGNQSNIGGNVNTDGGMFNTGTINAGGGSIIGRDKVVQGDEVQGDKVAGDKTTAHIGAGSSNVVVGKDITQTVNTLGAVYAAAQEVPGWVAAATRHLEQRRLVLGKQTNLDSQSKPDEATLATMTTLAQIEQIVAKTAQPPTATTPSPAPAVPPTNISKLFTPVLKAAANAPEASQDAALTKAVDLQNELLKGTAANDETLAQLLWDLKALTPGAIPDLVTLFTTVEAQTKIGPLTKFALKNLVG